MALVRPEKEVEWLTNASNFLKGTDAASIDAANKQAYENAAKLAYQASKTGTGFKQIDTNGNGDNTQYGIGVKYVGQQTSNPNPIVYYLGGGYSAPDYTADIAAAKAAGERGGDQYLKFYNDALADAQDAADRYGDIINENLENAGNTYNANMAMQRKMNDDKWYSFTQRMQNTAQQTYDKYNTGLNGSTMNRIHDLFNLTDDQFDQENLTALKLGQMQYFQNYMDYANNNINQYNENLINTENSIKDLRRQAEAALTNYSNDILSQLAAYGDESFITKDGEITDAGWKYLEDNMGLTNDGNGNFQLKDNIFGDSDRFGSNYAGYLEQLRDGSKGLVNADYLQKVRDESDIVKYRQSQRDRMKESYGKATNSNQYYTDLAKRGY